MSSRSGQVALEFMVLAAAILVVFSYMLYLAQMKYISFDRLADEKRLQAMGYELTAAIENVCEPSTPDTELIKVPSAPFTRLHANARSHRVYLLREGFYNWTVDGLTVNDRLVIESHDLMQLGLAQLQQKCTDIGGTPVGQDTCDVEGRACTFAGAVMDGIGCLLTQDPCESAGGTMNMQGGCDLGEAGCGDIGGVWTGANMCDLSPLVCADGGGAWHDGLGLCGLRVVSVDGFCHNDFGDNDRLCGRGGGVFVPDPGGQGDDRCLFFQNLITLESCELEGCTWDATSIPNTCDISACCDEIGGVLDTTTNECNVPDRARSLARCVSGEWTEVWRRPGRYRPDAGDLCAVITDVTSQGECDRIDGFWDVLSSTCDVTTPCWVIGGAMDNNVVCGDLDSRAGSRERCEDDTGGWEYDYDKVLIAPDPAVVTDRTEKACNEIPGPPTWIQGTTTCTVSWPMPQDDPDPDVTDLIGITGDACNAAGGAPQLVLPWCTLAQDPCGQAGGAWTAGDCDFRQAACEGYGGVWDDPAGICFESPVVCEAAGGIWQGAPGDTSGPCELEQVGCRRAGGAWDAVELACVSDGDEIAFTRPGVYRFRIETDPPSVPPRELEVRVDAREVEVSSLEFAPSSMLDLPMGGIIIFTNPGADPVSVVSAEQGCSNGIDLDAEPCAMAGSWHLFEPPTFGITVDFCILETVLSDTECMGLAGDCTFDKGTCAGLTVGGKWNAVDGECVLDANSCGTVSGAWTGMTETCEIEMVPCQDAGGSWETAVGYHWHNTFGCINNRRVTREICETAMVWGPVVSLQLDSGESAEVALPEHGTFRFHLVGDEDVMFTARTVPPVVMLGAEHLNSLRELRRARFVNKDPQALTVVSRDGGCTDAAGIQTLDRTEWACTSNGQWLNGRCIYQNMNEPYCRIADGFWDRTGGPQADGACYILSRTAATCAGGPNPPNTWTYHMTLSIDPGQELPWQFDPPQAGGLWDGTEFRFYIGEEVFRTIDLDISQDSLVQVQRQQGFTAFDDLDTLAHSSVPVTFTARTEPFDIVVKGIGTLKVSCQSLDDPGALEGTSFVVVEEATGLAP